MNRFSSPVYQEDRPQILREKGLSENKKGLCFHTLIFDDLKQLARESLLGKAFFVVVP